MVTKVGLVMLLLGILSVCGVLVVQWFKTGSIARGDGFHAGPTLGLAVLVLVPASLLVLVIGSLVDSARYGHWKKANNA
ncbi:MAG: hypothetical protein RBS39_00720 [Phycisphaerales bacterium]|nr:hypothetical protein [Phycisphaerales bacterium]